MKRLLPLACVALLAGPALADMPREGEPVTNAEAPVANAGKAAPGKKDGDKLNLGDFKGKKNVVLFFFPKAMTRGWTIESCGFRDKAEQFARLDTVVIGVSVDSIDLQKQFAQKEGLNFPLLSDSDKSLSKRFGVLNEKGGYSNRATFVIDKTGTIAKVYPKVGDVNKHPEEVLRFVQERLGKN